MKIAALALVALLVGCTCQTEEGVKPDNHFSLSVTTEVRGGSIEDCKRVDESQTIFGQPMVLWSSECLDSKGISRDEFIFQLTNGGKQ